ncbi:MAG: diaminopimelate epimerase [Persicimonas sp.]
MKTAPFYKYHGLGNDFVIVDEADWPQAPRWVEALCDRNRGVGADGLLFLRQSADAAAHIQMVIYNRDGSRSEMCGNGVRCVVRHLVEARGVEGDSIVVATDVGARHCRVVERGLGSWRVEVEMGRADIESGALPVEIGSFAADLIKISMGNPHAIAFASPGIDTIDRVGIELNADHPSFAEGVNVEFVEQDGPQRLRVVVYERGVGRTMACGTGACAAAVAAIETGRCGADQPVEVELPGGVLQIELRDEHVYMTGPADFVFDGTLSADWFAASRATDLD